MHERWLFSRISCTNNIKGSTLRETEIIRHEKSLSGWYSDVLVGCLLGMGGWGVIWRIGE